MLTGRPTRVARCGLPIHPPPTAVIACRQANARQASAEGNGTVDVLGVPPDGTQSRRGFGVIQRSTARKRRRRPTTSLGRGCGIPRHAPRQDQDQRLGLKWRGHVRASGLRGHCRLVAEVRRDAEKAWRSWRSRRRRQSPIGGEPFPPRLETDVLPTPQIVHNLSAVLPGSTVRRPSGAEALVTEEPSEFIAHVRVCGGAGR